MLAQNFKTPAALGIADHEFDALVKVLGMLEREEIKHASECEPVVGSLFNMCSFGRDTDCGTIGCIAGWARVVSNGKAFPWATDANNLSPDEPTKMLEALFYPSCGAYWGDITPSQAATALRSYLTTGDPCWPEAFAA